MLSVNLVEIRATSLVKGHSFFHCDSNSAYCLSRAHQHAVCGSVKSFIGLEPECVDSQSSLESVRVGVLE